MLYRFNKNNERKGKMKCKQMIPNTLDIHYKFEIINVIQKMIADICTPLSTVFACLLEFVLIRKEERSM